MDDPSSGNADESFAEDDDSQLGEFSLDDLGAAYARAAAAHDPESFAEPAADRPVGDNSASAAEEEDPPPVDEDQTVHPEGIIEAALFVGHPENQPMTATKLASLMRDVCPQEVTEMVASLNESYKAAGQALRIVEDENGYRMTIAPAVEHVRQSFLGRVREARLSQAAVEVLALVAYQPGITAQTVQDQRGRESATILNQLVRRRLLEMRREAPADGGRKMPHYYPAERFLALFGLESVEDLPMVDDSFFGQT